MQLATINSIVPIKPLPVRETTGPADWKTGPVATLQYARSASDGRSITDSVPAFVPSDFVKVDAATYQAALEAARQFSTMVGGTPVTIPVATALLQAKDGAWYVAHMGQFATTTRSLLGFPNGTHGAVTGAQSHVDALRAIVGGTMYAEFDAPKQGLALPATLRSA